MTQNKLLAKTVFHQFQTNVSTGVNQGQHQGKNDSGSNAAR